MLDFEDTPRQGIPNRDHASTTNPNPAGDAPDPGDLDAYCRASSLAGYKRPKAYVFVDTLPRNAANKILRRVLRDQAVAARDAREDYHPVSAS